MHDLHSTYEVLRNAFEAAGCTVHILDDRDMVAISTRTGDHLVYVERGIADAMLPLELVRWVREQLAEVSSGRPISGCGAAGGQTLTCRDWIAIIRESTRASGAVVAENGEVGTAAILPTSGVSWIRALDGGLSLELGFMREGAFCQESVRFTVAELNDAGDRWQSVIEEALGFSCWR